MPETVRNKVYELRSARGLTQEELALKVGVSRQTVIAIEKGNYVPSVLLALKLSVVFRSSVEKIFQICHEK